MFKTFKFYFILYLNLLILGINAQTIGVNIINPQSSLDVNGDLALRKGTLSLAAGANHNVDITSNKYSVYNFAGTSLTGGAQITGFLGGNEGRLVSIFNNTNSAIQLYNENIASTASNRIVTGSGATAIIYQNGSVTLRYDSQVQRWTIIASNYTDGLSTPVPPPPAQPSRIEESSGSGTWGDCSANSITAFDAVGNPNGQEDDYFGNSVSISGDYAIVGADSDDEGTGLTNYGSATIFKRNLSTGAWDSQGKILNINTQSNDYFGASVSISGDYVIVGAPFDDEGTGLTENGSATIFKRNMSTGAWESQGKLVNPSAQSNDKKLNLLFEELKFDKKRINKLALPFGDGFEMIALDEIIRCKSESNYTIVYLRDKRKVTLSKKLKEIEENLNNTLFFRVHNSHLINTSYVVKFYKGDTGYVVLNDGTQINISRTKKEEFYEFMRNS